MSLAYIHNRPIDAAEANVGAVMRMVDAFARAGVPVDLTAYAAAAVGDPFRLHGVDRSFALHLAAERSGPLSYPALVLHALIRGGGGIVYTRVPQVALYAMALGRRAVLEMHTPIGALRRGERLRRLLDFAAPRLQGMVTISPALEARLREELPRFRGPWVTAPSAAPDLSAPAGAPQPDHDLGYVGALTPGKGADTVLALAERLPQAKVLIAGDASGRPDFTARAAALPNLTLLGAVAPAQVAYVMARFRIGLAPYGRVVTGAGASGIDLAPWMSPLKLAEYASAGKAIVAARLPAVQAMLSPEEAVLCPPDDLDAWAHSVRDLIADPDESARLSAAARTAFETRFSWDARAQRIIAACRLQDPPRLPQP